jgi:hypothetical protein
MYVYTHGKVSVPEASKKKFEQVEVAFWLSDQANCFAGN